MDQQAYYDQMKARSSARGAGLGFSGGPANGFSGGPPPPPGPPGMRPPAPPGTGAPPPPPPAAASPPRRAGYQPLPATALVNRAPATSSKGDVFARMIASARKTAGVEAPPPSATAPAKSPAVSAAPANSGGGDNSIAAAIARARAIAAQLASGGGAGASGASSSSGSTLGKRKNRWDTDPGADAQVHKEKVVVPVESKPDVNWAGIISGPTGSTIRHIESKTGARVLLRGKDAPPSAGAGAADNSGETEALYVMLMGSADAVAAAKKEVEGIIADPAAAMAAQRARVAAEAAGGAARAVSSSMTSGGGMSAGGSISEEMHVEQSLVGFMIGKGGENIHEIQDRTGATIQVQKEFEVAPGATSRIVTIMGAPDRVAEAKRMIQAKLDEKSGGGSFGGGSHYGAGGGLVVKIVVPNGKVGLIIGKMGATIKGIQDRSGAHIQVPREPDATNPAQRTIDIEAPSQASADAAKAEIEALLAADAERRGMGMGGMGMGGMAPVPPGSTAIYVPVPNECAGLIIGRRGATISDMQYRTQTRIQVPPQPDAGSNPATRTIEVTGPPQGCEAARMEIENLVATHHANQQGMAGGYGMQPGYGQPYGAYGAYGMQPQQMQPYGAYGAYGMQHAQYAQQQQQQQLQQQGAAAAGGAASGAPAASGATAAATPTSAAATATSGAAAGGSATTTTAAAGGAAGISEAERLEAWRKYYEAQGYQMPKQ